MTLCFSLKVFIVRQGRRSLGYGFASFSALEEAEKAAKELSGKELDGRELNIQVASPQEAKKKQAAKKVSKEVSDRSGGLIFSLLTKYYRKMTKKSVVPSKKKRLTSYLPETILQKKKPRRQLLRMFLLKKPQKIFPLKILLRTK